jgi:hypothetical protein
VYETQGKCRVPMCCSVDILVTTCGLTAANMDLVEDLYQLAYCQVQPPTGSLPVRDEIMIIIMIMR